MGDPLGIGPEVVVKSLTVCLEATVRVYGCDWALRRAADAAGIANWPGDDVRMTDYAGETLAAAPPRDSAEAGAISFRFVEDAIADAKRPPGDPQRLDAIVTAPISKKAWELAGHADFPGHTELFAERFGAPRHAMMFVSPRLRVVLATCHVPLRAVPGLLTGRRVRDAIELGADACTRLGIASPRIALCGLNPHAGEGGRLGSEDSAVIEPEILSARQRGIDARGPFPADTVFRAALRGDFDLVVAMYHDQGLIPVKLLDFENAVNLTLGLPIVRTSPDHGTAFDIAGHNRADARSMRAAIDLAIALAAR